MCLAIKKKSVCFVQERRLQTLSGTLEWREVQPWSQVLEHSKTRDSAGRPGVSCPPSRFLTSPRMASPGVWCLSPCVLPVLLVGAFRLGRCPTAVGMDLGPVVLLAQLGSAGECPRWKQVPNPRSWWSLGQEESGLHRRASSSLGRSWWARSGGASQPGRPPTPPTPLTVLATPETRAPPRPVSRPDVIAPCPPQTPPFPSTTSCPPHPPTAAGPCVPLLTFDLEQANPHLRLCVRHPGLELSPLSELGAPNRTSPHGLMVLIFLGGGLFTYLYAVEGLLWKPSLSFTVLFEKAAFHVAHKSGKCS